MTIIYKLTAALLALMTYVVAHMLVPPYSSSIRATPWKDCGRYKNTNLCFCMHVLVHIYRLN